MKQAIFFSFFLLFLHTSCADDKPKPHEALVIPTSESKYLKIFSYDPQGKVRTIIMGKKNVVFRNSKEIWLDKIRVLHFVQEGDKVVHIQLTADKGKVNYKNFNCEAWSHAVVIRDKEVRIETERIFWNHEEKKIYTKDEEKVVLYKIVYPDDPNDQSMIKTIGKNLIADNSLKTIELDESVSATPRSVGGDI